MAAIIAQLARANYERKKNAGRKAIPPEKSNIYLPPFDEKFVPEVHNYYLSRQRVRNAKQKEKKIKFVGEMLEESKGNILDDRPQLLAAKMEKLRWKKIREAEEREEEARKRREIRRQQQRQQQHRKKKHSVWSSVLRNIVGRREGRCGGAGPIGVSDVVLAAAGAVFVGIFTALFVFLFGMFYMI